MHVVYFAHFVGGPDAASAMDADLFRALEAQGHRVTRLGPFRDPMVGRIGASVAQGRLPRLFLSIAGYARMMLRGWREAKGGAWIVSQYHVFHPATMVAFLVARLLDVPLVTRAHDPLPGSYRSGTEERANRLWFLVYRHILRHEKTWVAVPSPELRQLAATTLGLRTERVVVVANNVTPLATPEPDRVGRLREAHRLRDRFLAVQFGSFTERGMATFVQALRHVQDGRTTGVVLTDKEWGEAFRQEARRAGTEDRLLVVPTKPAEELGVWIAAADACVGILSPHHLARGSEPRSTMEAMAAGKPVVLCRGVVSSELAEEGSNCLMVPPDDPRALAAALTRIRDDPALAAQIGRSAKATIDGKFRSEVIAHEFADILRAVHGTEAPRRPCAAPPRG